MRVNTAVDALTLVLLDLASGTLQVREVGRVEELGVLSRAFAVLVRDLEVALEEVAVKNLALAEANSVLATAQVISASCRS